MLFLIVRAYKQKGRQVSREKTSKNCKEATQTKRESNTDRINRKEMEVNNCQIQRKNKKNICIKYILRSYYVNYIFLFYIVF